MDSRLRGNDKPCGTTSHVGMASHAERKTMGDETVAIWGCGPVGQFAIKSAWLLGASRVIAIDNTRTFADIGYVDNLPFGALVRKGLTLKTGNPMCRNI